MFLTGSMLSTWDGEGEVRLLSYLNSLLIVMMRLQGEEYPESGEWVHSQVHKNQNSNQRPWRRDFPGGPVVKNQPSNAGDTVSSLVGELRSHIWGGNWALEPQLLSPHHNYWRLCARARAPQGKARATTKTWCSQINKYIFLNPLSNTHIPGERIASKTLTVGETLGRSYTTKYWNILSTDKVIRWNSVFPGGSDNKEFTCRAEDPGSIPESGRSPGEGNGNPLQYSGLKKPMGRGAWRAAVHGVKESDMTE